jgi:hypothetical protein
MQKTGTAICQPSFVIILPRFQRLSNDSSHTLPFFCFGSQASKAEAEDSVRPSQQYVHMHSSCLTFRAGQICGVSVGNIAAVSIDGSFSAIGAGVSGGYILAIASSGYEM